MKAPALMRQSGFSLVEVTLALGIAALGIIAVLGLMPQGLEMSRRTGQITAQRQITEQIARNLDQKPWSEIVSAAAPVNFYFDDQGLEVIQSSPVMAFVAEVQVVNATGAMLPKGANAEPFMRKVLIKIANTPNPGFQFNDENNRRQYVIMTHLIAKGG